MYVKVQYFQDSAKAYGGNHYLYKTNLPLRYGDPVIAPTYRGNYRAIVTAILDDPNEIRQAMATNMREITEYDTLRSWE